MRTAILIAQMVAAVAGLLAVVAALLYGTAWLVLMTMRLLPVIGRRYRHERWGEPGRHATRKPH